MVKPVIQSLCDERSGYIKKELEELSAKLDKISSNDLWHLNKKIIGIETQLKLNTKAIGRLASNKKMVLSIMTSLLTLTILIIKILLGG